MKRTIIIGFVLLFAFSLIGMAESVEESMTLKSGNHDLPAIFEIPDKGEEEFPAILMIHGFGSTKNEVGNFYKDLADELADNGIATLRFDFPGCGDSDASFVKNSVASQISDSQEALNWLASSEHVNEDRLGVIGFSLGGIVASSVAGGDERVKAMTLWSSPAHTVDRFMGSIPNYTENMQKAKEKGSVEVDLGWRKIELSDDFFNSLYSSFPLHDIRGYDNPLLVVAGEKDEGQPQDSRKYVMNTGSYDVTLRVMENAGHVYNVLTDDQSVSRKVINLTTEWFDKWL